MAKSSRISRVQSVLKEKKSSPVDLLWGESKRLWLKNTKKSKGGWKGSEKKKSTKTQTLAAIFRVNESLRGRLVEMKNPQRGENLRKKERRGCRVEGWKSTVNRKHENFVAFFLFSKARYLQFLSISLAAIISNLKHLHSYLFSSFPFIFQPLNRVSFVDGKHRGLPPSPAFLIFWDQCWVPLPLLRHFLRSMID